MGKKNTRKITAELNMSALYGKGGKRAISVAGNVCSTSVSEDRISHQIEIAIPHVNHFLFFCHKLHQFIIFINVSLLILVTRYRHEH